MFGKIPTGRVDAGAAKDVFGNSSITWHGVN